MWEIEINKKIYKNPLIVFAMKEEATAFLDFRDLIFTGVGKVNAGYYLMKELSRNKPDIIINLGTAGGLGFAKGEVVCCNEFVQRDMDVTPLGVDLFMTPFSKDPVVFNYGITLEDLPLGICGSGDNFEVNHNTDLYNVVDMEAYVLALIAKRENIDFLCLKYISDGADDDAAEDWTEQVARASVALKEKLPFL